MCMHGQSILPDLSQACYWWKKPCQNTAHQTEDDYIYLKKEDNLNFLKVEENGSIAILLVPMVSCKIAEFQSIYNEN